MSVTVGGMTETERTRWNRARAYAENQRCDAAAACDYADWLLAGVRGGYIALPTKHEPWFAAWYRHATTQAAQS